MDTLTCGHGFSFISYEEKAWFRGICPHCHFFTLSEIIKSCFFLITSKYEVLAISLCYTILFLLIRRREWIRLHVATAFPSSVTRKKHDFVKTQKTIEKFRSSSRVARYWQPRPSRRKFVQVFLDSPFLNRFSWLGYQNVRLEKLRGASYEEKAWFRGMATLVFLQVSKNGCWVILNLKAKKSFWPIRLV